jgi:GT2 family glycosyltransferase
MQSFESGKSVAQAFVQGLERRRIALGDSVRPIERPQELTISPVGANMAYKKAVFEEHGFFRTDLGKIGKDSMLGEEVEFCMRLFRAGRKVFYAPEAIVYHPVEMAKLKKTFETHYFNWGRYLARVDGFPKDAVRYFGVPRYLFRSILSQICMWVFALDSRERFHHKLQVYEFLGEISEAHRLSTEAKQQISRPPNSLHPERK